jgi:hypothetical protein
VGQTPKSRWAARRFPEHDAFLFFTKNNKDAKAVTGADLELGVLATAIADVGHIRKQATHVAKLEQWISERQYGWYLRYNPPRSS